MFEDNALYFVYAKEGRVGRIDESGDVADVISDEPGCNGQAFLPNGQHIVLANEVLWLDGSEVTRRVDSVAGEPLVFPNDLCTDGPAAAGAAST